MIKVDVGDQLVGIGFEHKTVKEFDTQNSSYVELSGAVKRVLDAIEVRHTICTIYLLEPITDSKKVNATPLVKGVARCSPLDNFKKENGRKLALSRALKQLYPGSKENADLSVEALEMNRKLRAAIWEAYHSRWVADAQRNTEKAVSAGESVTA